MWSEMDIYELLLSAAISIAFGGIGAYLGGRALWKYIKLDAKQVAFNWLNSETGQKALFDIGGLIAGGAKTGFGLNKTGGKKGLEGFIMELAGNWLQRKMGIMPGQPQPSNSQIEQ